MKRELFDMAKTLKNKNAAASLESVVSFMNAITSADDFSDYEGACNGLQVENSGSVTRIACAVDASLAELEAAENMGADLLIVHHGLFWSQTYPFVGAIYERIKKMIEGDIAVYSSHLPLDAHPEIGNNALIAKALDLKKEKGCFPAFDIDIGCICSAPKNGRTELSRRLKKLFPQTFKGIEFGSENPKKVAICSGSCGDAVSELPSLGVDTLICGELRQRHFSVAQELKLNLYPCGHYATERFGVVALAQLVAEKFGLDFEFIEMNNPL